MNKKHALGLLFVAMLAVGIGANPRFIEELKIGGGFGDTADGGADFEKDGDILTNGNVSAAAFLGDGGALTGIPTTAGIENALPISDSTALVADTAGGRVRIEAGNVASGATRVIMMPDADVDLSAFGGGASLPVDDTTAIVQDPADTSKRVRIDAGAIAAATTRTLAMPDQDVDLAPGSGTFQAADPDTAKTDLAQEWTRAQNFNATALTDAASISWDAELNQVASVTLAGNRTLNNPTNLKDGASYVLMVKQDATGGRTLAYGTAYKWPAGHAPILSTSANAIDILTFISDGTNLFGVPVYNFQ